MENKEQSLANFEVQKLIFETNVGICDTQYDFLSCAVGELERKLKKADSMDDLASVFKEMKVGDESTFPSFKHNNS